MSAARPAVLPFRPGTGWRGAGRVHRAAALLSVPLIAVLGWVLLHGSVASYLATTLALALAYGALARILRPYPDDLARADRVERRIRHGASALALALGTAAVLLVALFDDHDPRDDDMTATVLNLGVVGLLLAALTLFFGLVGLLARLTADERDPTPAADPGSEQDERVRLG